MNEILTTRLNEVLCSSEGQDARQFSEKYLHGLEHMDFPSYYQQLLKEKGMTRSKAVANSGIEVHYAYQILNGTKRPGRDKLLCLCIGGGLSVQESNRALERAELGILYPKRLRDAVIMIALNQGASFTWKVNVMLEEHGQKILG